jgi:hypothetical protein
LPFLHHFQRLSYGAALIAELAFEIKGNSMQRSVWKGAISFGVVHIPVQIFSAKEASKKTRARA